MVAMATRKMHIASFHGNGISTTFLTQSVAFVGPKYICIIQIVLICGRKHFKKQDFLIFEPGGGHFGRHLEYLKLLNGDSSTPP